MLRFAVVSSVVLCVTRVVAQAAPPSTASESAATVTLLQLIRSGPATEIVYTCHFEIDR